MNTEDRARENDEHERAKLREELFTRALDQYDLAHMQLDGAYMVSLGSADKYEREAMSLASQRSIAHSLEGLLALKLREVE